MSSVLATSGRGRAVASLDAEFPESGALCKINPDLIQGRLRKWLLSPESADWVGSRGGSLWEEKLTGGTPLQHQLLRVDFLGKDQASGRRP